MMKVEAALPMRPGSSPRVRLLGAVLSVFLLSGCWFGGDGSGKVSVFDLGAGDCVLTPAETKVELTEVERVACSEPHQMEVFALRPYVAPGGGKAPSDFPGQEALTSFADGACAESFTGYVGVDYRDSALYYTYVMPSARSWGQDKDRTVVCFLTTTGDKLKKSAKGTRW